MPTLLLLGTWEAFLSQSGLRGYERDVEGMIVELLEVRATSCKRSGRLVAERAERFLGERG